MSWFCSYEIRFRNVGRTKHDDPAKKRFERWSTSPALALYRAVFVGESNSIKIEILKFGKIKVTYLVKTADFNMTIKKNFLSRYPP